MKELHPPETLSPMPQDWNDHEGWNKYYITKSKSMDVPKNYHIKEALRFYHSVVGKSVWITGCGLELSVWLYPYLGIKIYASDFSDIAIQYQQKLMVNNPINTIPDIEAILKELKINSSTEFIPPIIEKSDFRYSKPKNQFDIIINNKAIQGLSESDINLIAKNFFDATKKGGTAIISTMNVQGRKRTSIEDAFLNAGYKIPNIQAEQWYRNKLEETEIIYAMVLGNPIIPQWGQYDNNGGKEQEEKDKKILRSFRDEYVVRLKDNYQKDKDGYRPKIDKIAYVIYNTG